MKKKERAQFVLKTLEQLFPEVDVPLNHDSNYQLLIAVLLSAQCTDERVNLITPALFDKGATPEEMVLLEISEIESIIKPCGLAKNKAKNIWHLSRILLDHHNGEVPRTLEELESLPGVGHKTASVVLCQAFKIPAFPVDTHIHRCAQRWGLSNGKSVVKTEDDLKKLFSKESWIKLHLQIIYFARKYCPARGHDPKKCPICSAL